MKKLIMTLLLIVSQCYCLIGQKAEELGSENLIIKNDLYISKEKAQKYFEYFSQSSLFHWDDVKNNCEDRANATSILLESWKVPNYKVWIFTGQFLGKEKSKLCGNCPSQACWKYHVATIIPYIENGEIDFLVVDPATLNHSSNIQDWADNISCNGVNYYFITSGDKYIFSKKGTSLTKDSFYVRNKKNFKWTMEGLSEINGRSFKGKLSKFFRRRKIRRTKEEFNKLLGNNPI